MLDQIVASHPGRVAAVEWHLVNNGSPMYSAEARAKSRLYPAARGRVVLDAVALARRREQGLRLQRLEQLCRNCAVASRAGLAEPDRQLRPGASLRPVQVEFVNDSAGPISATACVVVTEDSIYYAAANGDLWHSHVCRDYIPDQTGTVVEVPALGRDTMVQDCVLDPAWNEARCNLVVYLQTTAIQPDSSRPAYNAVSTPVLQFSGIAQPCPAWKPELALQAIPNPVRNQVRFSVRNLGGKGYRLNVLALDGTLVRQWSVGLRTSSGTALTASTGASRPASISTSCAPNRSGSPARCFCSDSR